MLGYACDIGAVERTPDPAVAKPVLTNLTSTSATLSASVDTEFIGGSASFHYGVGVAEGVSTPTQLLPAGIGVEAPATATLTGLTAGTSYRVRVVMHTALGDATSPSSRSRRRSRRSCRTSGSRRRRSSRRRSRRRA
jgi:hypothetical protein